jgi:hypothetical protein
MWEDPIVSDVRRLREQLASKLNFDVHAIFAEMQKRQRKLGKRLVSPRKSKKAEQGAAPDRDSAARHPGR